MDSGATKDRPLAAYRCQEAQGRLRYRPQQNRRRAAPRPGDSLCYARRFEEPSLTCLDRLAEQRIQKQIGIHRDSDSLLWTREGTGILFHTHVDGVSPVEMGDDAVKCITAPHERDPMTRGTLQRDTAAIGDDDARIGGRPPSRACPSLPR